MTNYEKIKAMSIDEMTEWLANFDSCVFCSTNCPDNVQGCNECFQQWLESESEEE